MDRQQTVADVSTILLDAIRECEADGNQVDWPRSLLVEIAARLPEMRVTILFPDSTTSGWWEARGHDGRRLGTVRRVYGGTWTSLTRSGARRSRRNGTETQHATFEAAVEHLRLELFALGWTMATAYGAAEAP